MKNDTYMPKDSLNDSFNANLALLTATTTVRSLSAIWGLRLQDADRKEIVAKAMENAWSHRDSFDPRKASFKTWVGRITRNCLLDYLKRSEPIVDGSISETELDSTKAPDTLVMENEGLNIIAQAIDTLPEQFRVIIGLLSEGKRPKDIAKMLNCSPNAAAIRCCRARKALLHKLEEKSDRNPDDASINK